MTLTSDRRAALALSAFVAIWLISAPAAAESAGLLDPHGNVNAAVANADTPASRLYAARCASCHDHPQARVPPRSALLYRPAETVRHALTAGSMRAMAEGLTDAQILSLVVFLTGREPPAPIDPMANACTAPGAPVVLRADDWTSTHGDAANTRYRANAGIDVTTVPRLKLKWSFAYPAGASGPVTLAGDRVFLASGGYVLALDASSGCTRWAHGSAGRIVRAVTLAALPAPGSTASTAVVFGDDNSVVTALDATTGAELWRTRIEEHVLSRVTAAPGIHEGRVYVPISGIEDPLTNDPTHECCTSRGGVAALDLATGKLLWKQYHISEEPTLRRAASAQQPATFGPAGAATYTPLAIDAVRGLVYASTAEEYGFLNPAGPYSVIAYDLLSGERKWQQQFLPAAGERKEACAVAAHTDCRNLFSMGTSVLIHTRSDGRQMLLVGQKWGMVYGLDPDNAGAVRWRTRVAQGGDLGGIMYGMASDGVVVYVPVSDDEARAPHRPGGLAALDPDDGSVLWRMVGPEPHCGWGAEGCNAAMVAAPTAVPGAVFTGSWDGQLRIHASDDGRLLRAIDTGHEFPAVNNATAHGGEVSGYPVVIGRNAVYVTSGASSLLHPGNALLMYTPEDK